MTATDSDRARGRGTPEPRRHARGADARRHDAARVGLLAAAPGAARTAPMVSGAGRGQLPWGGSLAIASRPQCGKRDDAGATSSSRHAAGIPVIGASRSPPPPGPAARDAGGRARTTYDRRADLPRIAPARGRRHHLGYPGGANLYLRWLPDYPNLHHIWSATSRGRACGRRICPEPRGAVGVCFATRDRGALNLVTGSHRLHGFPSRWSLSPARSRSPRSHDSSRSPTSSARHCRWSSTRISSPVEDIAPPSRGFPRRPFGPPGPVVIDFPRPPGGDRRVHYGGRCGCAPSRRPPSPTPTSSGEIARIIKEASGR